MVLFSKKERIESQRETKGNTSARLSSLATPKRHRRRHLRTTLRYSGGIAGIVSGSKDSEKKRSLFALIVQRVRFASKPASAKSRNHLLCPANGAVRVAYTESVAQVPFFPSWLKVCIIG